jgi:hypothetical protein
MMKRSRLKSRDGRRSRKDAPDRRAFREAIRRRCHIGGGFYRCQGCGLTTPAIECHHMEALKMGGSRDAVVNSPENGLGLCRFCHDWATNNPQAAKDRGWSK